MAGLYSKYQKLTGVDDEERRFFFEERRIKKEFIFVHFNAWECAACLSSVDTMWSRIIDLPPDDCPGLPNLMRCGLASCEACTRR